MFRTNFHKRELPIYKKAIIEYQAKTGIDRFSIKKKAYDGRGSLMQNTHALHDSKSEDLTLFWEIFEDIQTNVISPREMHLNMQYYMEYCEKNEYVTPEDWIKEYKHF